MPIKLAIACLHTCVQQSLRCSYLTKAPSLYGWIAHFQYACHEAYHAMATSLQLPSRCDLRVKSNSTSDLVMHEPVKDIIVDSVNESCTVL